MATIKLQLDGASVDVTKGKLLDQVETQQFRPRGFSPEPRPRRELSRTWVATARKFDLTLDQNGPWKIPGQAELRPLGLGSILGTVTQVGRTLQFPAERR